MTEFWKAHPGNNGDFVVEFAHVGVVSSDVVER